MVQTITQMQRIGKVLNGWIIKIHFNHSDVGSLLEIINTKNVQLFYKYVRRVQNVILYEFYFIFNIF